MEPVNIRQEVVYKLVQLDKKYAFLLQRDSSKADYKSLKTNIKENLDKLKSGTKILQILAYVLITITGVISFIKVLGRGGWPDLNKGALLILLTVTYMLTASSQKLRIERLEKQILLLDILEKTDNTIFTQ